MDSCEQLQFHDLLPVEPNAVPAPPPAPAAPVSACSPPRHYANRWNVPERTHADGSRRHHLTNEERVFALERWIFHKGKADREERMQADFVRHFQLVPPSGRALMNLNVKVHKYHTFQNIRKGRCGSKKKLELRLELERQLQTCQPANGEVSTSPGQIAKVSTGADAICRVSRSSARRMLMEQNLRPVRTTTKKSSPPPPPPSVAPVAAPAQLCPMLTEPSLEPTTTLIIEKHFDECHFYDHNSVLTFTTTDQLSTASHVLICHNDHNVN